MPKVRLLAATSHPDDGSPLAAGQVIDVNDETFAAWRQNGLASSMDDEEAAAKQASEGVYNARTGREDTPQGEASTPREEPPPPPKKK